VIAELPNGVDLTRFSAEGSREEARARYGIPSDARLLLFVAALDRAHHFKGLGHLLRAMADLPPEVWLLVAGDGDLRQAYELQAHKLGLVARTIFAGEIEHGRLPALFRGASVTVLPSSPPESFGLVLLESMACATPVIASNIPGVRAVVDHGADGLLVPPADPSSLARAILRLLQNEELRRAMGQRGRLKVEARYSWTAIGSKLEQLYREVLERAPASASVPLGGER
jgi:glycosyltransferase involved in cell wall biosynthesis